MDRRLATKTLAGMLGAPLLGLPGQPARADADPPLTIVVPYAPGGTSDRLGRLLALWMAGPLARTVLVENRPGAGSAVGAAYVARAAPDGHTLLLATSSTLAINPSLYPALPYDPPKDFVPIGMMASVPLVLVVNPSVNARQVSELVSLAKSRSGGLSYGSAGNVAPAGTPKSVVDRLNRLLVEILDRASVREALQRDGVEPRSSSPEQLSAAIRADSDRWARIIKAARITIS